VKVKLDEGLPISLAERLGKLGIDADTVFGEGLAGHTDAEVLAAASGDDRIVFTLDRGFGNIRTYPPGTHGGVVVLRLDDQSARAAISAVEYLVTHHDLADLAGTVTVVHRGLLRIRRQDC
jgi:predicted nuclease of predicted toxin-antitoxin system